MFITFLAFADCDLNLGIVIRPHDYPQERFLDTHIATILEIFEDFYREHEEQCSLKNVPVSITLKRTPNMIDGRFVIFMEDKQSFNQVMYMYKQDVDWELLGFEIPFISVAVNDTWAGILLKIPGMNLTYQSAKEALVRIINNSGDRSIVRLFERNFENWFLLGKEQESRFTLLRYIVDRNTAITLFNLTKAQKKLRINCDPIGFMEVAVTARSLSWLSKCHFSSFVKHNLIYYVIRRKNASVWLSYRESGEQAAWQQMVHPHRKLLTAASMGKRSKIFSEQKEIRMQSGLEWICLEIFPLRNTAQACMVRRNKRTKTLCTMSRRRLQIRLVTMRRHQPSPFQISAWKFKRRATWRAQREHCNNTLEFTEVRVKTSRRIFWKLQAWNKVLERRPCKATMKLKLMNLRYNHKQLKGKILESSECARILLLQTNQLRQLARRKPTKSLINAASEKSLKRSKHYYNIVINVSAIDFSSRFSLSIGNNVSRNCGTMNCKDNFVKSFLSNYYVHRLPFQHSHALSLNCRKIFSFLCFLIQIKFFNENSCVNILTRQVSCQKFYAVVLDESFAVFVSCLQILLMTIVRSQTFSCSISKGAILTEVLL